MRLVRSLARGGRRRLEKAAHFRVSTSKRGEGVAGGRGDDDDDGDGSGGQGGRRASSSAIVDLALRSRARARVRQPDARSQTAALERASLLSVRPRAALIGYTLALVHWLTGAPRAVARDGGDGGGGGGGGGGGAFAANERAAVLSASHPAVVGNDDC